MKDLLNVTPFTVGDIIASFNDRGEYLDKPVLVLKVINRNGWFNYTTLRLDQEQKRINGTYANYSHASTARFKVIGRNLAAEILFSEI